jgi:hypothetical protein
MYMHVCWHRAHVGACALPATCRLSPVLTPPPPPALPRLARLPLTCCLNVLNGVSFFTLNVLLESNFS